MPDEFGAIARTFMERTWGEMTGNVALLLANGKTEPTLASPQGKLKVNEPHWFSYPDEMDLMVEFAMRHQNEDLYLTPATYGDKPFFDKKNNVEIKKDRHGRPLYTRSKENALQCQTIYMDSDACPPEAFRIRPSRHVDTSEGHGHDWWYLIEPIPASEAAEIAHRITTAHKLQGSDPSGWSENKVLRMPTLNTAYDELAPYEITVHESGDVYDATDISGAYDDITVSTAVQRSLDHEVAPIPPIEGLPDFVELSSRIPASNTRLNDLLYKEPKTGADGWRSGQRWALELDCLRFGFSDIETASLVWNSPSGSKWREDDRGFDGLWWEIQERALAVIDEERGTTVSAAPAKRERPVGPKLLTEAERTRFTERSDLITLYCEWARARLKIFNGPYHHINALTLLSIAFGETGAIAKGDDLMYTNVYTMTLGPSSSGKTEAKNLLTSCVHALFPNDNPDIGADHSKSALLEQLLDRDGKVTWLNADEFDGNLKELKAGGWTTGIQQTWTKIYDGKYPSMGRVGRKELNRAGARGMPVFHAMGTLNGMLASLDRDMFYTGYLARQIWVIGADIPETQDSMKIPRVTGDRKINYQIMPRFFATMFNGLRAKIRQDLPIGETQAIIEITDEAAKRFEEAKWAILKHFEKFDDSELWTTTRRRMYDITWKTAALVAMGFGRTFIVTSDIITALGYTEIWLDSLILVAQGISETFFSKQCDEIEKFVFSQPSHEADVGAIYRFRKGEPPRITDEYLGSLTRQGRLVESSKPQHTYRIRKDGK